MNTRLFLTALQPTEAENLPMNNPHPSLFRRLAGIVLACGLIVAALHPVAAFGQEAEQPVGPQPDLAEQQIQEALTAADLIEQQQQAQQQQAGAEPVSQNLWELYLSGGPLMIPITVLSLIAIAFGVERVLALRRSKIIPPGLVEGLGQLASSQGGLDPRRAYRLCQQYPSSASTVIRAMLLKVGRPHSEVEHAVAEASDREATRLYGNVRPISLTVSIAPLLGLLGTVQGMILAFMQTANAVAGVNKATQLAEGIYTALVTTFAGLTVAIPAAILAHYFEGRIMARFHEIDELVQSLLPQLERYEGKLRVSRQQLAEAPSVDSPAPAAEPLLKPAIPARK